MSARPSIADVRPDIGEYTVVKVDGTEVMVHDKPTHGVDGWVLLEMEWHPKTGLATYDYIQFDESGKYVASHRRVVRQPCSEKHEGWAELWDEPKFIYSMRQK